MKKEKYTVWMGFLNHWDQVNDKTALAVFFNKTWAEEYVNFLKAKEDFGTHITYGIDIK